MKLVTNARRSWRWFSMQAMSLAVAGQGAWAMLPDEMRDSIPQEWVSYATVVLLMCGIIGRLVDQGE